MPDNELYTDLLGITAPWSVVTVTWSMEDEHVDVFVDHERGARFSCPECATVLPVYDHAKERVWRHLDTCQLKTLVHAKAPRVECPTHGVKQVTLPWAEPMARFTMLFERFAIDVLGRCDIKGAAAILRLSWDEAHHIMERAVARGIRRRPSPAASHLGIDEKAYKKGHSYFTIISDLKRGVVLHLEDDRKKSSLDAYFDLLSDEEKGAIDAVCTDMWEPYAQSIREHLSDATDKIVYDRFHIAKHMTGAVNDVRKAEHRALLAQGDKTLTSTMYLWLYNEENVPENRRGSFEIARDMVNKTARAWALKEMLRDLWTYKSKTWAIKYWERWYSWAIRSRLEPVKKVARMLKSHLKGILAFFEHRVTNAGAEGINSRIQAIKVSARGYRNKDNFKTAIYFRLGGLDLHPRAA